MGDEWVKEKAYAIAAHAIGDNGHARTLAACISALAKEAITRTREAEHALAAEALRRAMDAQEKAVAAAYERCATKAKDTLDVMARAAGFANVAGPLVQAYSAASHKVTTAIRALAATLDKEG